MLSEQGCNRLPEFEEGKSSVSMFKPASSSNALNYNNLQIEDFHDNSIVGHLEAAMASVTDVRRQSREVHRENPNMSRLPKK